MNTLRNTIKLALQKLLPKPALQYAKKFYYARMLKSCSIDDEPDLQVVRRLVSPGDHAVDIGANIGLYTKFLSGMVGGKGRVHSFEPVQATYEILCSNLRKLKLDNVIPENCALSDTIGTVTMEVPRYETGGENYYEASIIPKGEASGSMRAVRVRTATMDSMFGDKADSIPFSFVKCDVEGHELAVLRGAGSFLKRFRPAWLVEVKGDPDDPDSHAADVFGIFIGIGYTAWWFDGTKLKMRQSGESAVNYFFLLENHIKKLKSGESGLVA